MRAPSVVAAFTQLEHDEVVSLQEASIALVDLKIAKNIDEVHHVARTTPSIDEKALTFEDLLLLKHNCQIYHIFQTVEVDKTKDHRLIADALEEFGYEVSLEEFITMVENIKKREGHGFGWPEFLQSFTALEQKAPAKHAISTQWVDMTPDLNSAFASLQQQGTITFEQASLVLAEHGDVIDHHKVVEVAATTGVATEGRLDLPAFKRLHTMTGLYHVFCELDTNGDGTVSEQELMVALKRLGHTASRPELAAMMAEADKDGDGEVDFREFADFFSHLECVTIQSIASHWLTHSSSLKARFRKLQLEDGTLAWPDVRRLLADAGAADSASQVRLVADLLGLSRHRSLEFADFKHLHKVCRLRQVFEEMDTDQSGAIEREELARALAKLGRKLTAQQVATLMDEVDSNGNGEVSFLEFLDYFCNEEETELADLASISDQWMCSAGMDVGIGVVLPPPNMPLWRFLLAGGLGGVCARTITAPLEKVMIQAQTGNLTAGGGTAAELKSTFRIQGVRGLFAGNAANCARVFPFGATVCMSYGNLLKILPSDDLAPGNPWEPMWRFIAGSGAGVLATLPTYPLDLIQAKMATETESKDERKARKARSGSTRGGATILSVGRQIVARDGWWGLYRGLMPTLATIVPLVGLQQMTYDVCRHTAVSMGVDPSPQLAVACGAAAGVVSQGVVYPMDLLRRRVQLQTSAIASSRPKLRRELSWSARQAAAGLQTAVAFRQVLAESGVRGLFAGITPTILKVMPAVAANVTMRDTVLGRLS